MNSTARGFTIGRLARERMRCDDPPSRSAYWRRRRGATATSACSDPDAERLRFVRHCRDLGFSLGAVRELLSLADHPDRPCVAADRIVETHLREVEQRIERLHALQAELQRMVDECRGGRIADCRIISADHRHRCPMTTHPQGSATKGGAGTPAHAPVPILCQTTYRYLRVNLHRTVPVHHAVQGVPSERFGCA